MSSADVEARLAALEQKFNRVNDEREIEKLMTRQEHTQNPVVLCPRRARRVSGSGRSWTIQRKAALQTLFQEQFGSAALKGNLLFPFLTTGCVEVAADGKTAKGTWRSPCVQAVMPKDGKGEPQPIWLFGAYAVDFVKKGSEWKIWHFHWFRTIKCSHEEGWVKDRSWLFAGLLPNSPDLEQTTYHNPYTPDSIQDSIPPCPLPFETYNGPYWMIKDQAELWNM